MTRGRPASTANLTRTRRTSSARRRADDVLRVLVRFAVEAGRPRVIGLLVAGQLRAQIEREVFARRQAAILRRRDDA